MPLHRLPLALTVLAVLALGVVAIICSTSGGADWLQKLVKRDAAAPGAGDDAGGGRGSDTEENN